MKPGIYPIDADTYHGDPCDTPSLSRSVASTLTRRTPLHAWTEHPRLNPNFQRVEKDAFDLGTAAHTLLLEGDDVAVVVDAKDWRTNAAKDERAAARAAGKIAMLEHQWRELQAMVDAARRQIAAATVTPPLFTDGKPEQTVVWNEPCGVTCRARPDWLRDDRTVIDDYKTTGRSADPTSWIRQTMFTVGYDVQVAFYKRGVHAVTGRAPDFRFVVQETYPPYALSVVSLAPDAEALAHQKVEHAIRTWARCLRTGQWPAYPTEVCYANTPGWEEAAWLERVELDDEQVAA